MISTENIPAEMRAERRWLVWRLDHGKKVPYSVASGRACNPTDPANWSTFEDALAASARYDGVGFALGDKWTGVDLDDCRDVTGELTPEAARIVADLNSYTEVSPSRTGVKIFIGAESGDNPKPKAGLEVYRGDRYFTVTGDHLAGTPTQVEWRKAELATLVERELGVTLNDEEPKRVSTPLPREIHGGSRNNLLFSEAGRLRHFGYDYDEMLAALLKLNETRVSPPLDEREVENIAKSASRYAPAEDTFGISEAGDAESFAADFGDRVRFDYRRMNWLIFDGHRWRRDPDGELHRLGLAAMRSRQRRAVGQKDRLAHALKGESRSRIENMLALARAVNPISDTGDGWDGDPYLLGVENGVVNLLDGSIRPGRPEDRLTMSARVPFDATATCPLWEETVSAIFGGDADLVAYIQRAFGYSLTGDCREECLFFCWGDGRNGKGTLMNTFAYVLGDYADDLPFSALELHDRAGIPNDIAKLVGKRYATASESGETVRLNESRVKALTGRDPITARFMRAEFFTFQPVAKFWLATNKKPIVRDDSQGFWSRIHLIPFTQTFAGREDKQLKDKLRAEAPGILAWAVRGCLAWQRDGLNPPSVVRNATEEYRRESEPLTPFFDACCVVDDGKRVQSADLYQNYVRWSGDARMRMSLTEFGKQVKKRFVDQRKNGNVWYVGLGLRNSQFPEPENIPF